MIGSFEPDNEIRHISLIGVGGTGSIVARGLGRLLFDMHRSGLSTPTVRLIDPDRVEAKNVGRQALFSPADEGAYKSDLLASRINKVFGLSLEAVTKKFDARAHRPRDGRKWLLIDCTDNHEPRIQMAQACDLYPGTVWLSSGNHVISGQVCIGTTNNNEQLAKMLEMLKQQPAATVSELPHAGALFPELLKPETEKEVDEADSCAEQVLSGSQSVLVNDWQGTAVLLYLHKLLYRKPIRTFLTYLDTETISSRSVPISVDEMRVQLILMPCEFHEA